MRNILHVSIKRPWGRTYIYPKCRLSLAFCNLLNQKALTEKDIENIKKIGFVVKAKEAESKIITL